MHTRTKKTQIPRAVKLAVWERDGGQCVICGSTRAFPEAHYISRAQGGRGIEQNIVTLCRRCHFEYDNSENRPHIRRVLRDYLSGIYPGWDESELVVKK